MKFFRYRLVWMWLLLIPAIMNLSVFFSHNSQVAVPVSVMVVIILLTAGAVLFLRSGKYRNP